MSESQEVNQSTQVNADKATPATSDSKEQKVALFILVIIAAVIGGYYLAKELVPTPKIGVINLQTQVSDPLAEAMAREIDYAIKADDIKGVVVVIASPGGGAAAGHEIYLQMRKLRDAKPVVASMDVLAASAAYQIGVGANEIYGKPASLIGNIGVIMGQPSPEVLSERFITTGPFKAIGGSATSYLQKLDMLHADFRDSVVAERSNAPNPLKLSPDQVATGEIWIGVEAKEYGLIDEIGSKLDAIERAAELAGVEDYEVASIRTELLDSLEGSELLSMLELYEEIESQPAIDLTTEAVEYPSFYQIYIPLE